MRGNDLLVPARESPDASVTIGELLQRAANVVDRVDARWILQSVLNTDAAFLIAHAEQLLSTDQVAYFRQMLARRIAGEPVAYLTGERGFYDLVFEVTPDVLIPRPETELLVEMALSKIPSDRKCNVLDLGTGSGAIAITLARHRASTCVTAVDFSPGAMAVARRNARMHAVKNVVFIEADWFSSFTSEKFDVIVANPPYVAAGDPHLEEGDLRFEPLTALHDLDPQFAFQPSDPGRQGRLRDMADRGRTSEVTFARQRREVFQLPQQHGVTVSGSDPASPHVGGSGP